MCGRFTLRRPDLMAERFQATLDLDGALAPRYNVAPTQPVPIVVAAPAGRVIQTARWGLIPGWAKDPAIGSRMINARAETLAEKPSFRAALRSRRCLVPADGFYEWQAAARRKVPHLIEARDGDLFAFAGLYEHWRDPAGAIVTSCTIITTAPNDLLLHGGVGGQPIHDRMPAILRPEHEAVWLDPALNAGDAWQTLVEPYPADWLAAHPVGSLVNSPANDRPEVAELISPTS
jgi:putative SOS response-associated peptidase YedK